MCAHARQIELIIATAVGFGIYSFRFVLFRARFTTFRFTTICNNNGSSFTTWDIVLSFYYTSVHPTELWIFFYAVEDFAKVKVIPLRSRFFHPSFLPAEYPSTRCRARVPCTYRRP